MTYRQLIDLSLAGLLEILPLLLLLVVVAVMLLLLLTACG